MLGHCRLRDNHQRTVIDQNESGGARRQDMVQQAVQCLVLWHECRHLRKYRRRRASELENIDAESPPQKRLERTVARRWRLGLDYRDDSWVERVAAFRMSGQIWNVMRTPSKGGEMHPLYGKMDRIVAMMRSNVGHTFRVIKRQFARVKTRYRGVVTNSTQLFVLGKLFMVRRRLMA